MKYSLQVYTLSIFAFGTFFALPDGDETKAYMGVAATVFFLLSMFLRLLEREQDIDCD